MIMSTKDYSTRQNRSDTTDKMTKEDSGYTKDTTAMRQGGADGADVYG